MNNVFIVIQSLEKDISKYLKKSKELMIENEESGRSYVIMAQTLQSVVNALRKIN